MAAPAGPALRLSDDVRVDIERVAHAAVVEYRLVVRGTIVLAAADGDSTYAIAKRLGCSPSTVRKWRVRATMCSTKVSGSS